MNQTQVYIVDGVRTPFLKSQNRPGDFSASDMAVTAGRSLLTRQPFSPRDIDEVILGCMMPSEEEANIGRLVGLRLGCGKKTPGWTVQRNCASGMQSLDSAIKDIQLGRSHLVLAGGTEAMSRAPVILNKKMTTWLGEFYKSKTILNKMGTLFRLRPEYLKPTFALMKGLTDPLHDLIMGQTAEILAYQFNISRKEMDEFAFHSHQKVLNAQKNHYLTEITPLFANNGKFYEKDNGVRADTSLEKLATLKPFPDRRFGLVTPGNSSQVTDGAAMLLLASEEAVNRFQLPVLGKIIDVNWAGLGPEVMGLGPVMATTPLLQRNQLTLAEIDFWEINEAFAAQVLACLKAWESDEFCREDLGLEGALGSIDRTRLNVDGGAIALGHPVGASGARIVMHLLEVLKRNNAKRGIAAICIGGGQGGAMLVENSQI